MGLRLVIRQIYVIPGLPVCFIRRVKLVTEINETTNGSLPSTELKGRAQIGVSIAVIFCHFASAWSFFATTAMPY